MTELMLIAPLHNFGSDKKLIELSDKSCIRRIRKNELRNMIHKTPLPEYQEAILSQLSLVKYTIEEKIIVDSNYPRMVESKTVGDVLDALRLLQAGDFNTSFLFLFDRKEDMVVSFSANFDGVEHSANPFFLKMEQIPDFIRLLKKLQVMPIDSYLRLPLFEFTYAFEKNIFEERIIHHITAFESLVFHQEDKSIEPVGKVLGIAIGWLLGKNQRDREKIRKNLVEAYELRNAVIHGNLKKLKKSFTDKQIERLSIEIEDYLRQVLKKFIQE